ncbi:hypothetical protein Lfu02_11350 [Longispora fulva]|nr:hypothetical protein Lfu02_11350 [Longispora fulva]
MDAQNGHRALSEKTGQAAERDDVEGREKTTSEPFGALRTTGGEPRNTAETFGSCALSPPGYSPEFFPIVPAPFRNAGGIVDRTGGNGRRTMS